jgi:hypothetical protein
MSSPFSSDSQLDSHLSHNSTFGQCATCKVLRWLWTEHSLNGTNVNENLVLRQNPWSQQPNGKSLFQEINHNMKGSPTKLQPPPPISQETKSIKELARSFDHNKCRQLPYYSRWDPEMLIADAIATYNSICVCVCVYVELFCLSIGCMNYLETHQKRKQWTLKNLQEEEEKKLSIGNDESSLVLCPNSKAAASIR